MSYTDQLERMLDELSAPIFTWRMSRAQLDGARPDVARKQYESSLAKIDMIVRNYMNEDMYVALYPRSDGNPSDKFRVCKSRDFQAVISGEKDTYPFTPYDTMDAAVAARDKLNKDLV